eukprot:TRINITY_DN15506_c0_g1_i1.p1 TRINITY_DN15506_c0_g1~~TRINITY_DN15506_c0_g1_i1.p1  ORF type:complete len:261 (-),score=57.67 TRINITY_DN15506_c0_g1_i1:81-863(-)
MVYSFTWRLTHWLNYMNGGLTFLAGSFFYYPFANTETINGYNIGAWLYTLGSTTFLIADCLEWWSLKAGCVGPCSIKRRHSSSTSNRSSLLGSGTNAGIQVSVDKTVHSNEEEVQLCCSNPALGINFFSSATGSLLYLIGSIGFIPVFNILPVGIWGFIAGSAVIVLGQAWKVYRLGTFDDSGPDLQITPFKFANWKFEHCSAFLVDFFAGAGALMFLIGTFIYNYHPELVVVVHIWVTGSVFFTVSGIALFYRHLILGL